MIYFYCEQCEDGQPVEIEPLVTDELNPDIAWGDIVCEVCHFVIANVSTDLDKQGKYDFVMVKTLKELESEFNRIHPEVIYRETIR